MTISSTSVPTSYTGNGSTVNFSFPYQFSADTDLVVVDTVIATGVETIKTLTTHYTVTGAGNPAGGTVTAVAAPASTVTWTIFDDPALTQGVDLVENDPLPVETAVEAPLDKLTRLTQRTRALINRSLRLPDGDTSGVSTVLPSVVSRAGKLFGFGSSGEPVTVQGLGTSRGTWATGVAYVINDFVTDGAAGANTKNVYVALSNHTSGVWATDLAAVKWKLQIAVADITGPTGPIGSGTVINRDVTLSTVVNTATETTVYSFVVPGGTLGTDRLLSLRMLATYLNNSGGNKTLTFRVKFGGNTVGTVGAITYVSNGQNRTIRADFHMSAKNATNSQVHILDYRDSDSGSYVANGFISSTNSAVDQTLSVTVEHNGAHALTSFDLHAAHLELL